ncbi:MAG: ABC-2 type transport system permease protein [Arenicella sp.]|jgi:ABC-2 type transport system permease protein
MLSNMLKFEWRYFTRQPSFIVTCLVFILLPFLAMTVENVQIGGGGNVTKNSPYAISEILLILSIFSMFVVVNFIGNTATRNHTQKMAEIIGTKPIQPFGYNLGRFLGSYLVCLTVFLMVPIGALIGSLMPWVDAERIGPNQLSYYAVPFIIFSTTTIFTLSAIFYAVARKTNSLMIMYVIAVAIYIAYSVSGTIFDQPDQRFYRALFDPFGLNTFREASRYWTPFERNNTVASLSSTIVANRALWLGLGLAALATMGGLFKSLRLYASKASKTEVKQKALELPPVNQDISYRAVSTSARSQFFSSLKFEIKQTIFSAPFLILLIISVAQLLAIVLTEEGGYGQPMWPITQTMVESIAGGFGLLMLIIMGYFTAEVVWRERTAGIGDITDSTPTHNAVMWASKLISVCLVLVILMLSGIIIAVALQASKGYSDFEFGQYFIRLMYFGAYPLALTAVLAFFIQTISPNKYIGMMAFAGFIILQIVLFSLGVEHTMYSFGESPALIYSDMNGYGDYLTSHHWYMLYWTALAIILGLLSFGLWRRGPSSSLVNRMSLLTYQLGKKGLITGVIAALVFIGSGANIYYNTRVLNPFLSTDDLRDLQADYEKTYSAYQYDNNPIITSVDIKADIFPKQRRIEAAAKITVENRGKSPISRFLIAWPRFAKTSDVQFDGGSIVERDDTLNSAWFEFSKPLEVGEIRQGLLTTVIDHDGFKDKDEDFTILENGTFINNTELLPYFGYNRSYQLVDRHQRRKRDLGEPKRAHKLEDQSRYSEHAFDRSMTFIDFKATVSTTSDQIAIAPGYLTREWEEGGRKYFRYEMDSPILNFFSINSGRMAVKKEDYKGVSIEVYYHPTHYWNVDDMIKSTKDSLDYFQGVFGPYQHRQYRIIEFPRYRSFAQSFANTIPFAEGAFLSDQRSDEYINQVYFVNAHEMAHQWWGHQLGAANVEGSAVLSETLAEYSALIVMEKAYGETNARKFLTYELDRYLRGRTGEILDENPLLRTDNQQYIHYQKGAVVMMALRHRMGEDKVNQALKGILDEFKYKDDPFPTTLDLVRHLKTNAKDSEKSLIDDLFNQITLYEMRAEEVSSEALVNGQFKITFKTSAKKFIADGKGEETEQPLEESVEIAMFSNDPNKFGLENRVIYKQQHLVVSGDNSFEIIVDEKPAYIGIDPFVRFIDRDTGNNILQL